MRRLLVPLMILATTSALAGQALSPRSLYIVAATTPPDKIPALCDKIVARQDTDTVGMTDAAQLYFHGQLMGVHCVRVDYVKALTLAKKAGDRDAYNTYLRLIKNKAEDGNPLAQTALDKLGTKPM